MEIISIAVPWLAPRSGCPIIGLFYPYTRSLLTLMHIPQAWESFQ
jgi:hypothetical protein